MINILKLRKMQKSGAAKQGKDQKLPAEPEKVKAPAPVAENNRKEDIPSAKVETIAIPEFNEPVAIPEVQEPENLMSGLPKVDVKAKEPEKPLPQVEQKPEPAAVPEKIEEPKKESSVQELRIEADNKNEETPADLKKDVIEEIIQLVGFNLGAEYYGVEITKIHEIIRMVNLTRVPRTPAYIEGVINLRGSVLPVVNLRTKVKMPKKEYDKSSRIIVVDLSGIMVGFIVDSVQEVIRIPKSATQPPPDIITGVDGKYFTAVATLNNQLLIILDIEKVLMNDEKKDSKKVA